MPAVSVIIQTHNREWLISKTIAYLLNQTFDVLIEGKKEDKWFGRNRNDKLVFLDDTDVSAGETINVRINKTSPWYLNGAKI